VSAILTKKVLNKFLQISNISMCSRLEDSDVNNVEHKRKRKQIVSLELIL
jgi:hypothetical protein